MGSAVVPLSVLCVSVSPETDFITSLEIADFAAGVTGVRCVV